MTTTLAEYYRGAEAAGAVMDRAADPAVMASVVHRAVAPLLAAQPAGPQRACKAGCTACCHFPVGISYGEASLLAAAVAAAAGLAERVMAAAEAVAGLPNSSLVGLPCPLLIDGRCAVYEARPLPCRALASADATACGAALAGSVQVPRDEVAYWRGLGAAAVLAAAEPAGTRELRSAVAALLTDPVAAPAAFTSARSLA